MKGASKDFIGMGRSDPTKASAFKRTLQNLLSAPPKLHSEMKLEKKKKARSKSPKSSKV
jgi:hypothetical protein